MNFEGILLRTAARRRVISFNPKAGGEGRQLHGLAKLTTQVDLDLGEVWVVVFQRDQQLQCACNADVIGRYQDQSGQRLELSRLSGALLDRTCGDFRTKKVGECRIAKTFADKLNKVRECAGDGNRISSPRDASGDEPGQAVAGVSLPDWDRTPQKCAHTPEGNRRPKGGRSPPIGRPCRSTW